MADAQSAAIKEFISPISSGDILVSSQNDGVIFTDHWRRKLLSLFDATVRLIQYGADRC